MCSPAGWESCVLGSRAGFLWTIRQIADQWGRLNALGSRNTVDSLIAATAHVHELTVVTRSTKDFRGCDVPLLNPWEYNKPPQR